jgi:hypothetical protein
VHGRQEPNEPCGAYLADPAHQHWQGLHAVLFRAFDGHQHPVRAGQVVKRAVLVGLGCGVEDDHVGWGRQAEAEIVQPERMRVEHAREVGALVQVLHRGATLWCCDRRRLLGAGRPRQPKWLFSVRFAWRLSQLAL